LGSLIFLGRRRDKALFLVAENPLPPTTHTHTNTHTHIHTHTHTHNVLQERELAQFTSSNDKGEIPFDGKK
jgi:hypothetical protein